MIIGLFPALAAVGGVQVAGRQTAAALTAIARDHSWPCVFLSLNDAPRQYEATVGDISFCFTGFARRKSTFFLEAIRLARREPRFIFAAHPHLAPIVTMMKGFTRKVLTVVGAHGVEIWRPLPVIRRKSLCVADVVIAPSTDTMRRLQQTQGVPASKIRRLPWPLDPEFAEIASAASKIERPVGFPDGLVVLTVGRWAANERYKGADILIESVCHLAEEFSDLHLVLVGSGDDTARLERKARDSAAKKRVHFVTDVSRSELARYYTAADVFALPSTGEGFGLVFLEAMACAKPVIGTNIGGIPDVVENDREGFLVEPTRDGVSGALRRLLSDQCLREELGKQGKRRVNTEFTFENFQRTLLGILNEIV